MNRAVVFLILILIPNINSYNILAVFHFPSRSSFATFQRLLNELAFRGHNLTVISNFSQKENSNYNEVLIDNAGFVSDNTRWSDLSFDKSYQFLVKYLSPRTLSGLSYRVCSTLFATEDVQNLYKQNITYDVILLHLFQTECVYQFAKKFKSHVIGVHSSIMLPWTANRFGLPVNSAVVPSIYSQFSTNMSFFERLENTLLTWCHIVYYRQVMLPMDKKMIENRFGAEEAASLEDLLYKTSLFLLNTHYTVNLPRVMLPNVIEVGGIHIGKSKALQKVRHISII